MCLWNRACSSTTTSSCATTRTWCWWSRWKACPQTGGSSCSSLCLFEVLDQRNQRKLALPQARATAERLEEDLIEYLEEAKPNEMSWSSDGIQEEGNDVACAPRYCPAPMDRRSRKRHKAAPVCEKEGEKERQRESVCVDECMRAYTYTCLHAAHARGDA